MKSVKKLNLESGLVQNALEEVINELKDALKVYPRMVSPHEGYAIIKEEVDELWDEIKPKPYIRSNLRMREEAKQIAAMPIRFMIELT